MGKYTTIRISKDLQKKLSEVGHCGETWEDAIKRAVEAWEEKRREFRK